MKRFLCLALLVAFVPLTSFAQDIAAFAKRHNMDEDAVRWQLTEEQLVRGLQSPIDAIVMQNLHNAIILSIMNREAMNVHRVGNSIVRVHKKTKNPEVRDAALAALLMVGSDSGLAYARQASKADKEAGRNVAFNIIDNHFEKQAALAARPRVR